MSASSNSSFTFPSKELAFYLGIPILISGVLGGIFNLIVFLSLQTFRQSSCTFFLTVMSFVNIGQLLTGLFSRIMITGFNIDWTESSLFYCKFRNYSLQVCALTSYTCMCLATIDQYMATSRHIRWQQSCNIKRASRLCAIVFLIWLLHSIPSLIWFNHSLSQRTERISCMITNPVFQQYFSYVYILILAGVLPLIIAILFGSLAYWNVRQIPYRTVPLVRRELDKQLTSMVLIQVAYEIFAILPYITVIFLLNTLDLTNKSISVIGLNFANFVTGLSYYTYFASPFYIYVCVSKRFRQQFMHVIFGIYCTQWKRQPVDINQVLPEGEEQ